LRTAIHLLLTYFLTHHPAPLIGRASSVRACVWSVQVLQYNPSHAVVSPPDAAQPSDPSLLLVPAASRYSRDIRFPTSSVSVAGAASDARNYVTVVSTSPAIDSLSLDGTRISQHTHTHTHTHTRLTALCPGLPG